MICADVENTPVGRPFLQRKDGDSRREGPQGDGGWRRERTPGGDGGDGLSPARRVWSAGRRRGAREGSGEGRRETRSETRLQTTRHDRRVCLPPIGVNLTPA
jgi:hypothetical protein